jgi:hypothetical protein
MSFGRLVADHLVDRRFEPERLTEILSSRADRRAQKEEKGALERTVFASRAGSVPCSQMSTKWRATVDEAGHYSFAVAL